MTMPLPLELAEVFKGAQVRAHRDVSLRLLQQTMAKLAAAGAGRAAISGRQQAQLVEEQAETAPVRFSEQGTGRPLSEPLRPSQPSSRDGLPTYTNLHEMDEVEKQAFIFGLARRGAAALARRGGRLGRVGSYLQRPIRSPLTAAAGKGSATVGVRSPLGQAPIVTNKPIPKPASTGREAMLEGLEKTPMTREGAQNLINTNPAWQEAVKKKGGPFRSQGRTVKPGQRVQRQAPEGPTPEPRGGYFRKPVKGLVAAGLIGGGLYAAGKGGSKAVDTLQQATAQPMRPNISGWRQYPYGF